MEHKSKKEGGGQGEKERKEGGGGGIDLPQVNLFSSSHRGINFILCY